MRKNPSNPVTKKARHATRKIIFRGVSTPIARLDKRVIDGSMYALGTGTERASRALLPAQSGKVQVYAIVFVLAVLAITVAVFLIV